VQKRQKRPRNRLESASSFQNSSLEIRKGRVQDDCCLGLRERIGRADHSEEKRKCKTTKNGVLGMGLDLSRRLGDARERRSSK